MKVKATGSEKGRDLFFSVQKRDVSGPFNNTNR